MQQPQGLMPAMSPFPAPNITTEQIQKYLDENKKLILAILDNQNLGKLAECAQYQAQLQKNLMYLAAIADAQPQTPAMPTQMTAGVPPHPAMQQGGGYYMHPQGGAMMGQQPPGFSPKMQMQFAASPHQLHQQQQQQQQQHLQQQAMQGQMNVRPVGPGNGMHHLHSEAGLGGGGGGGSGGGQNRQSDAPGSSSGGNGDKGVEEGK